MSAKVFQFPGATTRPAGTTEIEFDGGLTPRGIEILEQFLATYRNDDPVDVAGALITVLAGICHVNAVTLTDAFELVDAFTGDLRDVVKDMAENA